jgi:hypothetical protein
VSRFLSTIMTDLIEGFRNFINNNKSLRKFTQCVAIDNSVDAGPAPAKGLGKAPA